MLVRPRQGLHKREMTVPEIFDRKARRLRRRRSTGRGFFTKTMVDDLLDRLDDMKRDFRCALVVGGEPALREGLQARNIPFIAADPAVDEDRLVVDDARFDLIVSSGSLDTIADLPGALVLMQRSLRPDGLFLANFSGAPSLTALRAAMAVADAETGSATARIHPQIDVRSAGDLLVRAGFALPMADLDTLDVAYSGMSRLVEDLREAGATNILAERHPLSRSWLASASKAFVAVADEGGRTHETLSFITLTGWAPAPDQPKPAARGSGKTSLATALTKRTKGDRSFS